MSLCLYKERLLNWMVKAPQRAEWVPITLFWPMALAWSLAIFFKLLEHKVRKCLSCSKASVQSVGSFHETGRPRPHNFSSVSREQESRYSLFISSMTSTKTSQRSGSHGLSLRGTQYKTRVTTVGWLDRNDLMHLCEIHENIGIHVLATDWFPNARWLIALC